MQPQISVDNLNPQTLGKDFSKKSFAPVADQPNTVFEECEGVKSNVKLEGAVAGEQDLEVIDYNDFSNFETKDLIDEYKDMIAKGEISRREATEILAGAMSMVNAFNADDKANSPDAIDQDYDNIFESDRFEDMLDEIEDNGVSSNLLGNFMGTATKWLS